MSGNGPDPDLTKTYTLYRGTIKSGTRILKTLRYIDYKFILPAIDIIGH